MPLVANRSRWRYPYQPPKDVDLDERRATSIVLEGWRRGILDLDIAQMLRDPLVKSTRVAQFIFCDIIFEIDLELSLCGEMKGHFIPVVAPHPGRLPEGIDWFGRIVEINVVICIIFGFYDVALRGPSFLYAGIDP